MRPNAILADIPSTHNASAYIHNAFIKFIKGLKVQMQVSTSTAPYSSEISYKMFTGYNNQPCFNDYGLVVCWSDKGRIFRLNGSLDRG